jgi:hypothetical protein
VSIRGRREADLNRKPVRARKARVKNEPARPSYKRSNFLRDLKKAS